MRQRLRSNGAALCNLYIIVVASRALFLAREMVPFDRELLPTSLQLGISFLARALVTHNGAHPVELGFVRVIHCPTLASKAEELVVLKTRQGVPQDAHSFCEGVGCLGHILARLVDGL